MKTEAKKLHEGKRLLTICPSIRDDRRKEMKESFIKTSKCSDIIFVFDKGSITELINKVFNIEWTYEYYHITNDDFIYHTDGWDMLMCDQCKGVSYANDLMSNIPTAPLIDGRIARTVGWLQMPKLYHLFGDIVWQKIGQELNVLKYHKDIIIEHKHYMSRKAKKDSVYEKTNSPDMYNKDQKAYREWLKNESKEQIESIRMAMRSVW